MTSEAQLQIVLMGWEWDRLVEGIKHHMPKKVVFICPKESNTIEWPKETKKLAEKMGGQIKALIDYEFRSADYQDFSDCLSVLKTVLNEHADYPHICINISTGSKLLIAAAVVVSQYYPCNLFYAVPSSYNIKENCFTSDGVDKFVTVPTFQFSGAIVPKKMEKSVFQLLDSSGLTLTSIVMKHIGQATDDYTVRKTKSLFLYHLKNLEKKNLVTLESKGRQTIVSLTSTGEFLRDVALTKQ
ncbi:hypothetical protein COV93_03680 [Candidatus Woesearchaeota archaeon CG11_big_fil_rev_8_21_14_0_20_43_8]|nr:MAG: hypothetical protein COV93_03680 [Candidatus Woesearchaeota archaeon CG11_big_fil_rev_8_21_14_0_20_43_8]PIO08956.1 MAG: hypothetical protein COT47_00465 [Candidatus Woesearchaeota archaeon CG08_land_8_20_14_0_20_43_7]